VLCGWHRLHNQCLSIEGNDTDYETGVLGYFNFSFTFLFCFFAGGGVVCRSPELPKLGVSIAGEGGWSELFVSLPELSFFYAVWFLCSGRVTELQVTSYRSCGPP